LSSHNHGGEYLRREYEDLRREYEDLRREYEDLRYTFNNPGKVSSVWQIPPAKRNGHETPKPEALLERIIETTSNPGDIVLDPMFGSGTAGSVAARLGRGFVGCEIKPNYFEMGRKRIEQAQSEMVQLRLTT
jgi:DNA modification methylase